MSNIFAVIENKFGIILVTDHLSRFFCALSRAMIAESFINLFVHVGPMKQTTISMLYKRGWQRIHCFPSLLLCTVCFFPLNHYVYVTWYFLPTFSDTQNPFVIFNPIQNFNHGLVFLITLVSPGIIHCSYPTCLYICPHVIPGVAVMSQMTCWY